MTRLFKFLAAAVPMLAATLSFGEIAGSKHDFSATTWGDEQICKPCHTPHNAIESLVTGRLWAHTLSTATYTFHGTQTRTEVNIDEGNGTAAQTDMDRASRLCLSCHDGTVALDSFMGKNGTSDGIKMGGDATHGRMTANLGGIAAIPDLANDHPVGLKAIYQDNVASGGHYRYKPRASLSTSIPGFKMAQTTTAYPAGAVNEAGAALTGNMYAVSCVTCHDVHDGAHVEGFKLLRVTNDGSALCLACHNK